MDKRVKREFRINIIILCFIFLVIIIQLYFLFN